ncbi:MAG: S8/S53 family peptidase [Ktedonobacteraceae bacterium]|nr:S8/S53 family peptidase [Ktedonobacteraceae bacterium]
MKRTYIRSLVVVGMLLLITGAGIAVKGGTAQADTPVVVDNHVDPALSQSQLVQTAPVSQPLDISVGLQMRNKGEFDSLLKAIYDPASSSYHHYLTPDQFNQEFAPTDDQVQQVETYLQGLGMAVKNVAPDNLLLNVGATVEQAQQAFNVQINTYRRGRETYYANSSPIKVPSRIRSLVMAVTGLDSRIKLHHHYQNAKLTPKLDPVGYGPRDISNAYDIGPLQSAGFLGDRQTIALLELDGYQPSDIVSYMQYFNPVSLGSTVSSVASTLTPALALSNLTNVLVDNYSGAAGQGAEEVSLDIEMIDAIAPHANTLVYEGPNTMQGMNDTYARIVNDNKAQIVSISWGLCEQSTGNAEMQLLDNLFRQGVAQGMSFFAAAGDNGAYDCGDTNLAVDYPASDPYVTSVGGTSLQLNVNGTIKSESVWSDTSNAGFTSTYGNGSGGGLSSNFLMPNWQRGPGVQNSYSNGKREVPDVSANADNNYGYAIYCTVLAANCLSTGWNTIAGTSSGAPLWAASTALINQYIQAQGKRPLGQMNPVLYGLFNGPRAYPPFHDITSGTNLYYSATANYDLASGMGSPDVFNIARDLARQ